MWMRPGGILMNLLTAKVVKSSEIATPPASMPPMMTAIWNRSATKRTSGIHSLSPATMPANISEAMIPA